METILKTYNLCKKYGTNANKILACNMINININKGDIYGLVGKNGAGKTTLIRLITGLSQKSSGSYELFGIADNANINSIRSKCSGIVETPSIFLNLSAYDNLLYQASLFGIKDENLIIETLKTVGLNPTLKRKAKNFSLGMRQRLGIAICLIGNPEFIILDEPMNGLDPQGIIEIRELLLKLHQKGITILISSHILSELSKICTKYGFISEGCLIEEITVDELEKKCRKHINIFFDSKQDINVIKDIIKNMNYEFTNDSHLKLYEDIDCTPLVNLFSQRNILIKEIKYVDMDIEDYFIHLLGGKK